MNQHQGGALATAQTFEAVVGDAAAHTAYMIRLAIADLPVKPSRRVMRRVSVTLCHEGHAVEDADIAVGFHPLHAGDEPAPHGELLLAPLHGPAACPGLFDASLALRPGTYRVDVTVNRASQAEFVVAIF